MFVLVPTLPLALLWPFLRPPDALPKRAIIEREPRVERATDEVLMEQHLEGHRAAFEELVGRYSQELLHFLCRLTGRRAIAEDVFQETFLQVHLSAQSFDTSRRFKPWLFTIAVNKARDHHRRESRRRAASLSATLGPDDDGATFADLLEATAPVPEKPLLDAERSSLVKAIVDEMPWHMREILLLSYFHRLPYAQIAEALSIPLGTVKSRLHAAVTRFARGWTQAMSHVEEGERP